MKLKGTLKRPEDINFCKHGKKVILIFKNEEEYTGIFNGIDDDEETIMLQALKGKTIIGLPASKLYCYVEED